MEDEEYKKLPVEDRCVHKLWKARVDGYEEVTKLFRQIDDEKSPEFGKYLGLIKKFVTDSNAVSQEKGLEATLAFVENYAHAGKTVGEVMSGIIAKCIAAPRTKTRDLALQITLMYIEIEKQDIVQEELIKGMDVKNPKIVSACINACTTALREFGSKVFLVKPLVKKISVLFADRDKGVRDEARALVIEIYRWIGPALRSQLSNLQPVQVTELETEFAKNEGQKAVPTRYLKSQQEKQAKKAAEAAIVGSDGEEDETTDAPVPVDPYELADPVDVLSKIPKDFYEKIEAKKWQERKEALEAIETLVKTPKLENGDYGDLVRALKKVVQKDSNVLVVTLAAKCLTALASGLKRRFHTYAGACIPALLEKFKEKKQNVVVAVREAIDAIFVTTTVDTILEDVLEALNNKNPSVKSETALFLARSFTKTLPTALNKKLLKALTGGLLKIVNEPDPTVRDSTSEALGTLMKLVGEKAIGPFLIELEKDNLKMTKIRECCEKAVIVVKIPASKKERPTTAPAKSAAPAVVEPPKQAVAPKQARRPTTAGKKKAESSSRTATIVKSKGSKFPKAVKAIEREISDEEAVEIVGDILSADMISGLADSNWKNRLSSAEQMLSTIQLLDSNSVPTQALVRVISKKPGLKDTNFQVLKARLDVVKYLASNCTFSTTTCNSCINDITEKLGDAKNGLTAAETLTAIAEATSLPHVSLLVMDFASNQKSPKILQESLTWLGTAIKEFGFANLNAKALIESGKKALASNNPAVRQAAISYMGVLYLYMGPSLHMFFENEKPILREQICAEFEKYENEKPPVPTRGVVKGESSSSLYQDEDEDGAGGDGGEANGVVVNVQELLPRVDISSQITETLITELSNKNWKVRIEALTKINTIISEAKLIKPNIGDLPQALASRLIDSNSKIAQTALNISEAIANAMGPQAKVLIRVLFPGFLHALGDNKAWIRSASISCMNTFGDQCGYKDFFEGEMIADALKSGSPALKTEVWMWLSEKLPKIPVKQISKEELMACVPHLFANLEDRNAEVRKNAQEAVLGIMMHLSYENLVKQTEKLKPGSKTVVIAALDKARPSLPIKPLPTKKQAPVEKETKGVRGTKPVANSNNAVKSKGTAQAKQAASSRKKDDDIDLSPLLVVNNMKHQRTIDESKLKVLKWNFTAPREEFVELLKEQMANAKVNKTLMNNMFHIDFRYHIKAIESLTEDLPDNSAALISNLDLILKWLTLRFFDTNPSVLLKGLEYLHFVFNMLIEYKYHMLENEASSFIPYLILKIGDPKDAVRNGVRSLFKQICDVYAVSKLFSYIMEGLKSKNARQRAECLEVMGSIIEDYGITVCLPSPTACLKEVAKQISDRDNAVRNAALNCVVQAYYIVGEKVYKMVGQISDKDMSLLEERIKRAAKRPPPQKTKMEPINVQLNNPTRSPQRFSSTESSPAKTNAMQDNDIAEEDEDMEQEVDVEDDMPQVALPPIIQETQKEETTGAFSLDPEFMKELDNFRTITKNLQLQEFDLEFLKEEIVVPPIFDSKAKIMPLSPPKPIDPSQMFSKTTLSPKPDIHVEKTINQIANSDIKTALGAIQQMQEILQSQKGNMLVNFEDLFMSSVAQQFKHLSCQTVDNNPSILKVYRSLLTVIDSFYSNKVLGRKISVEVLKEIMNQLIHILAEEKLKEVPNGDCYVRVVNLHCVKIMERSDHTNIICTLVKLLYYCVSTTQQPRFTELVMKCLWKVIKNMPNWTDEIDYDSVLLEIHIFYRDYPNSWWRTKDSDTPFRTIKTILHSMVKMKGSSLMMHLGKIPNTNDSEIEAYILRLLKCLKMEGAMKVPLKTDTRRTLSRSTHTQLTNIFQKIGEKDETDEGLNMLYDFLQQHPEADIDPFLKRSSQFFQDYIQKNLSKIDSDRKSTTTARNEELERRLDSVTSSENSSTTESRDLEYWKQRLEMWKRVWEETVNKEY